MSGRRQIEKYVMPYLKKEEHLDYDYRSVFSLE